VLLEEFSSPPIIDLLESLLGPNIDFLRNRHNHATIGLEPTYRCRLHRDILQWSRNIVSVIVYLDDCSECRSATRVIPGSQLLAVVGTPNNGGTWMDEHEIYSDLTDQSVVVPASAGDILLLDGLVFHAGGLASTDNPRGSSLSPTRALTSSCRKGSCGVEFSSRGRDSTEAVLTLRGPGRPGGPRGGRAAPCRCRLASSSPTP
jgi:hypothetical protein